MVKIDNLNQTQTNPTESSETKTNPQQNQSQKPSGLMTILGQLLPLAPFVFEQITGQKVPAIGTLAEVQTTLLQIQTNLQTIVNNQQSLNQRLVQLETSATHQFNNLTHQFKNWRLTHTKEQQQIEYGNSPNSQLDDPDQNY